MAAGAIRPTLIPEPDGAPVCIEPACVDPVCVDPVWDWPLMASRFVEDHWFDRADEPRLANATVGATIAVDDRAACGVVERVDAAVAGTGVLTALVFGLSSRAKPRKDSVRQVPLRADSNGMFVV